MDRHSKMSNELVFLNERHRTAFEASQAFNGQPVICIRDDQFGVAFYLDEKQARELIGWLIGLLDAPPYVHHGDSK